MQKPDSPSATLEEELATCRALLQLLNEEQDLLVQADVEGLSRNSEEKGKLVARMTELAQQRHRMLAAAGFEANETGMQTWLKDQPEASHQSWNDLIELARSAKELNRINGRLIGQHMSRTQQALQVMQGPAQGGNLYGPDGQTTTSSGGRRLVVG